MCYSQSTRKKINQISLIKKFNISQKNAVDGSIHKCDYFSYTPPSLNIVSGEKINDFLIYLEKIEFFIWKTVILN